jgi:hypothetical protein
MTLEEKYKIAQKEIAVLLKANGFKKVGSKFYRELAAATCMVGFAKARGCGPDELCWQASGTIFLHALDPIFRAERDSTTLGTIDGDVNLLLCRPSGQLWEITEATNVASMVSDFQSVLLAKLDGLEQKGSLRSLAETYTPDHLVNPGKLSINGLVKTAVAAKFCGMTHNYEALLEAISKHSQGTSFFVKYHLGLVANK